MGYMTTITILNDHWDRIKANPEEFVEFIEDSIHDGNENQTSELIGTYVPPQSFYQSVVHKSHHADIPQIIFSQYNSTWDIGDITRATDLGYLNIVSNPDTYIKIYKNVAKEMRRQAKELDRAVKDYQNKVKA